MRTSDSARLRAARAVARSGADDRVERLWTTAAASGIGGLVVVGLLAWIVRNLGPTATEHAASGATCLLLAASVVPTAFGPVRASEAELWFFVEGPIGPGPLLRPRFTRWVVVSAAVVGVAGVVTGTVLGDSAPVVALLAVLGAAGGTLLVAVSTIVAAAPRCRWAIRACVLLLVVVFAASDVSGQRLSTVQMTVVIGVAAALCCAIALRALGRMDTASLHRDSQRRGHVEAALLSGDVALLLPTVPPHRYRLRARTSRFQQGLLARIVQRDVLGLRRSPILTALGVVAIIASGMLAGCTAAAPGGNDLPWAWALAVLLAQAGLLPVTVGLRERASQAGSDVLEPEPLVRMIRAHLVVPAAVTLVGMMVGWGLSSLTPLGGPGMHDAPGLCAAMSAGISAGAAHAWLAASGPAPLWVLAPVVSPIGELSGIVFIAWMGRGLLPAIAGAALVGATDAVIGTLVVTAVVLALAAARLRRLT